MKKITSAKYEQQNLFQSFHNNKIDKINNLSKIIDNINSKYGNNTLAWSSSGMHHEWSIKRTNLGAFNTTSVSNLPIVWT